MTPLTEVALRVTQHGNVVFAPGSRLAPRRLAEYELVWVVAGTPTWIYDGCRRPAPPGSVLLIQPNVPHEFIWDDRRCTQHRYMHFQLAREALSPDPRQWPCQVQLPSGCCALACFAEAVALCELRSEQWRPLAENALRQVLLTVVAGGASRVDAGEEVAYPPPIERLLAALDEQWRRGDIHGSSADELAELAGVSRSQLSRLCQRHLGVSPVTALRRMRLLWAAMMFLHTSDSIAVVARRTGFADVPTFSKAFTQVLGQTPGAFRRNPASQKRRNVRLEFDEARQGGLARALLRLL